MILKLYNNEIPFQEVTFEEKLGDINILRGMLKGIHTDLNDKISLCHSDNEKIFDGVIVNVEKDLSGSSTFLSYDISWKLKQVISPIESYNNWKFNELFNGFAQETKIGNISPDNRYLTIDWISRKDDDKTAIITGNIGEAKLRESIALSSSGGRKQAKSKWNLKEKDVTWTKINSFHIEDDTGKIVNPLNNIYLKDEQNNIIAKLTQKEIKACARIDENDHYANGLLYNSPYTIKLDLPDIIEREAIIKVEGANLLEIIRSICEGPIFLWGTPIDFQADFNLIDNTINLRSVPDDPIITLREDKEIKEATFNQSLESLVNQVNCITDDRVILSQSHNSIEKFGLHEQYDDVSLSDAEADYWVAEKLRKLSLPEEGIRCSTIGILPRVGYKARVMLPTFRVDKIYAIQEAGTTIGQDNIGISNLTLSERKIEKRWKIPFKNVEEIQIMKKVLFHR